jgi:hypothetical protein
MHDMKAKKTSSYFQSNDDIDFWIHFPLPLHALYLGMGGECTELVFPFYAAGIIDTFYILFTTESSRMDTRHHTPAWICENLYVSPCFAIVWLICRMQKMLRILLFITIGKYCVTRRYIYVCRRHIPMRSVYVCMRCRRHTYMYVEGIYIHIHMYMYVEGRKQSFLKCWQAI